MKSFGLNERELAVFQTIFRQYPEIKEVLIFGSRAIGNWKSGSDVDVALMNNVPNEIMKQLRSEFEDSSLPYFVDLLVYPQLKNLAIKEHIDRVGQSFYIG